MRFICVSEIRNWHPGSLSSPVCSGSIHSLCQEQKSDPKTSAELPPWLSWPHHDWRGDIPDVQRPSLGVAEHDGARAIVNHYYRNILVMEYCEPRL